MDRPKASVIVLAYGTDEKLGDCVASVLNSHDVEIQLVIVNNGSDAISEVPIGDPRITYFDPGFNTGFSGGCNIGASLAVHPTLVFLNSDAVARAGAIRRLITGLEDDSIGIVAGAVVLGDQPSLVMSAGNPIHYLFFTWTGSFGDLVSDHADQRDLAGAPGSFFAIRRELWDLLGGFEEEFFAFAEDANISVKSWQIGKKVRYFPDAEVLHFYEFSRVREKMFLVEKNRLVNVLTLYSLSSIVLLLPVILAVEIGIFALSVRGGWWRQKTEGWAWILRNGSFLKKSHQLNQSRKSNNDWSAILTTDLTIPEGLGFQVPRLVVSVLHWYFQLVRRSLN